MTEKQTNYVR